jgi:hypothetical protein
MIVLVYLMPCSFCAVTFRVPESSNPLNYEAITALHRHTDTYCGW